MGGAQAEQGSLQHRQRGFGLQRTALTEQRPEGHPVDRLHDDRRTLGLLDVREETHDVRAVETAQDLRLRSELRAEALVRGR